MDLCGKKPKGQGAARGLEVSGPHQFPLLSFTGPAWVPAVVLHLDLRGWRSGQKWAVPGRGEAKSSEKAWSLSSL